MLADRLRSDEVALTERAMEVLSPSIWYRRCSHAGGLRSRSFARRTRCSDRMGGRRRTFGSTPPRLRALPPSSRRA